MADSTAVIAELALASPDPGSFRAALFELLASWVGFDMASFHHAIPHGDIVTQLVGYDSPTAATRLESYMSEFDRSELLAATELMVDVDVLSRRRRERLSLYREQLRPHGVSIMATLMWCNRHGGFGFHLARAGRGQRFRRAELQIIERAVPAIKLAEAYLATTFPASGSDSQRFESWADGVGLSRAERRVAELATRGLHNGEIASILGLSRLTVRNQLGSAYRKCGVSNRAELAFLCASMAATPSSTGAECDVVALVRHRSGGRGTKEINSRAAGEASRSRGGRPRCL